jgi:hypothetical protein
MSSESLVRLTLRSRADGPSECLLLPAQHLDADNWPSPAGVTICDRPVSGVGTAGVVDLEVHDLLAESGHLQVAMALDELGRYRVLAHRLMVAVVGSLLAREGLLLTEPDAAHDALRAALDRLIDMAVGELT